MLYQTHARISLANIRRVGVPPEEAPEFALRIEKRCPDAFLEGVFTHLPVSDVDSGVGFTRRQIAMFRRVVDRISGAPGRTPDLVHCCSSGGVLEHREGWLTLVRTGTLGSRGRALARGRPCPIVGAIEEDTTLIDLGPEPFARVGDEAVLIGRSGDQEITAYEAAALQDTIPCAMTALIGPRVGRVYDLSD
ncbi:MAG: alanine racemase [Holophaga sp.]|jgi:alanine racemase